MKTEIHPKTHIATVQCACGVSFQTRATLPLIKVDICSSCHPFFTGKQRLMDAAGRVEKFSKRFAKTDGKTKEREKQVQKRIAVAPLKVKTGQVLTTTPTPAKKKKAAH